MKFISFMASQHGRLLRGSVGLVLTIAAILSLHGSGQVVALAIGGVERRLGGARAQVHAQ